MKLTDKIAWVIVLSFPLAVWKALEIIALFLHRLNISAGGLG